MTALLFVVAAGVGAASRHAVNSLGRGWLGTLAINVAGAFALGWLTAADVSGSTLTVLGSGFCGAFTTFSGLALETDEAGRRAGAAIVVASLSLGLLAAVAGHALG